MNRQAEILLDSRLAAFLAEDPELDVHIHEVDQAGETQAIRLALPDPVTIITVAAAASEIADRLHALAIRIKAWLETRTVKTTALVVRGETDDSLMEVHTDTAPEELADTILSSTYVEPGE